jgi:hypothetical protein
LVKYHLIFPKVICIFFYANFDFVNNNPLFLVLFSTRYLGWLYKLSRNPISKLIRKWLIEFTCPLHFWGFSFTFKPLSLTLFTNELISLTTKTDPLIILIDFSQVILFK